MLVNKLKYYLQMSLIRYSDTADSHQKKTCLRWHTNVGVYFYFKQTCDNRTHHGLYTFKIYIYLAMLKAKYTIDLCFL